VLAEELDALYAAKAKLSNRYLLKGSDIYGVGIGKMSASAFCLSVSGTEAALENVPDEFEGFHVRKRVNGPGVLASPD
jgi:hypothetical protein